jgi:hypothetical protein
VPIVLDLPYRRSSLSQSENDNQKELPLLKIRFSAQPQSAPMPSGIPAPSRVNPKLLKGNIMNTHLIKSAVALALSVLSVGAFATTYDGECTDQPRSRWMSSAEVKGKFESQGYSVRKVKAGGSCYEVYAIDGNGRKVELFVNPVDTSVVGQAEKK